MWTVQVISNSGVPAVNNYGPKSLARTRRSTHGKKLSKSMQDFARWAFGPRGLLSLEMVAVGDFSYQGRYAMYQVVFVRNHRQGDGSQSGKESFRRMLRTNERHVLIDDYELVLSTCPASHLLDDD